MSGHRLVLSRRKLLRGVAGGIGVTLGLPMLEAMLNRNGTALADGMPLPQRFGVFFWGNGVKVKYWVPAQTGAAWQLSPLLMPFAKVKDSVSIVSGTGVYTGHGHFPSLQGILSGAAGIPQGGLNNAYATQTMDQAIAAKIGTTTRFKSLELGVAATDASDADFGAVSKALSHNGPNSPNLPEHNPIALYDRVFGDGFSTPGSPSVASVTLARRKSVLDVVAADTRALQTRLGASDRQRLEQHLQGVSQLEKQLTALPSSSAACGGKPDRPASAYAVQNGQVQWEPLAAAQTNLLAMALACDQTRVFTFRFSPCNDYTVYPGFPTFTPDPTTTNTGTSMHGFTHNDPGDQPNVQKCVLFSMTHFAALLERLQAINEGAGSVLDNCAILGFTELVEGRDHDSNQTYPGSGIPMIVAGRAGGKLVHPGIHYSSPKQGDLPSEGNGRNVSVVPLTLMRALGTGITSWGQGAGQTTRVINELLT
jgi:hypothetical protein